MKNGAAFRNLSDEAQKRLAACKTQEEAQEALADEFARPLDEELLDGIVGG